MRRVGSVQPVVVITRATCVIAFAALAVSALGAQQAGEGRTTNDKVFAEAQATRGAAVYQEQCASCHGPQLAGIETLMAPPLAGPEFALSWNDLSVNDLFERIRIGMPKNKPGTLTREQIADALAFILRFNKSPSGSSELSNDADALKAIKIVLAK